MKQQLVNLLNNDGNMTPLEKRVIRDLLAGDKDGKELKDYMLRIARGENKIFNSRVMENVFFEEYKDEIFDLYNDCRRGWGYVDMNMSIRNLVNFGYEQATYSLLNKLNK